MRSARIASARIAAILLATVVLASCATDAPAPSRQTITARGLGEVVGVPDVLHLNLSVETRGATAKATLDDSSRRTTAVLDRLSGAGVDRKDLRTSGLSLYPVFDDKGRRITAYSATNVAVTLRDLAKAGEVIDAAAEAAGDATRLNGLSFAIDDTSSLYASARMDAVRRAGAQARQLARAAGVRLGKVRSIKESPIGGSPSPLDYRTETAAASGVPIEPGTQKLQLQVTLVYEIDD